MDDISTYLKNIEKATSQIISKINTKFDFCLILGTGLASLLDQIQIDQEIPYKDISGFPHSTAPGHAGKLIFGKLLGINLVIMNGRHHLYEGWSAKEIGFPIRVLSKLGQKKLIITNAAGALNRDLYPGDVMLISDHINMTGHNPLIGPHHEKLGIRFPDMSQPYSMVCSDIARECFSEIAQTLKHGVYAGITGPSLETSAERRFLHKSGADAVGMSTVMEVITAVQERFQILGISAITNNAFGGPDQKPDTIEEVLENAKVAGNKLSSVLPNILKKWKRI